MVKNSLVFLAVVAMLLFMQPVRAAVLYDSGVAWDNISGQFGIGASSGEYVTDAFNLSSASTITSIDLGLMDAMIVSNRYDPSTLVYKIENFTGTVSFSGTAALATLHDKQAGSSWIFQSEFLLPVSGLDLAAGTYYLTLSNGSATTGTNTREDIGWSSQNNNNLAAWATKSFKTAPNVSVESFIINGTTDSGPSPAPEPATMLLLGLGMVGLAGVRRFKR